MTKHQFHRLVNKEFYHYINELFPQYEIDPSEGYGNVYLRNPKIKDDIIQYHQSRHSIDIWSYSPPITHINSKRMENYLNKYIIPKVNIVFKQDKIFILNK